MLSPEKWTLTKAEHHFTLLHTLESNGVETKQLFREVNRVNSSHEFVICTVRSASGKDKKVIVNTNDGSVGDGEGAQG